MFALVDCNNFYPSCERVFDPTARNRPVVVLSNNDGCVIARSNEAKKLGIVMGTPEFQIRDMLRQNNIAVYSSNYTLYGDMSNRVMAMLSSFVPEMEIYSIDEAFLDMTGLEYKGLREYGLEIVRKTSRGTGIPLSMGIAPTKTLAKMANKFAKKYPGYEGVCIIDTEQKRIEALRRTRLEDVWGIGRRYARRLDARGIKTAYDLSVQPAAWVRKEMTVVGERMWNELNGVPCIDMDLAPLPKKQICTSRAFGQMLTSYEDISQAVASYACICAQKLRQQHSCAVSVLVLIHTNNFIKFLPQYFKHIVIQLPTPTNSSIEITRYALEGLKRIFRPGFRYKKAGVIITEIVDDSAVQRNLFDARDMSKHARLMEVMDKLNSGFRNRVTLASQGTHKERWQLRRHHLSPDYTTDINDILPVKAG